VTTIRLNGIDREIEQDATVSAAVALLAAVDTGCAVAVNDEVVPRRTWPEHVLVTGDRVEVLTAVQGG
jgi:sulfur carrier protein